jgi:hypothetical protein
MHAIFALVIVGLSGVQEGPKEILLRGVGEIAAPGIPGTVSALAPTAEVVVTGRVADGSAPVVVAARLGQGRVVAFGHDGYLGDASFDVADTGRLMMNAVMWAGRSARPRAAVWGLPQVAQRLRSAGVSAVDWTSGQDLAGFDLLVTTQADLPGESPERIASFVRRGGGLVAGMTGWGWKQIRGRSLEFVPLNRVVAEAGIAWSEGMLDRTSTAGFKVAPVSEAVHAGKAMTILERIGSGERVAEAEAAQAVSTVLLAAGELPANDPWLLPRLRKTATGTDLEPPSERRPVTAREPLRRVSVDLQTRASQSAPASEVVAHAAAAAFPGAVPAEAPRLSKTLTMDPRRHGWMSTGLYAAPGEQVTVSVPREWVRKGLAVRIGAHSDEIWHLREWKRAPSISRRFEANQAGTIAANAFGGLVYLEVPAGLDAEPFAVEFSGVLEAPLYRHGRTTAEQWARLRQAPGPWAEFETDKIVLTVPSEVVRGLDDPTALMQFWDEVMDACADLAAMPRERARPERIVMDVQISAGYMHAGYPIMAHLDVREWAVDVERLRREGNWGFFHEIGHNHQSPDWTFDGTGEVTVNLFSMYVYQKVLGHDLTSGHPAIKDRAARQERTRKHLEAGAPFERWKADPFLALEMYIQLIEEFGWEPYTAVFEEYRKLPRGERPRNDGEKRDQWMVRFSRQVGRNLGPFFQKWGVPTTEGARRSIESLPVWSGPS